MLFALSRSLIADRVQIVVKGTAVDSARLVQEHPSYFSIASEWSDSNVESTGNR